MWTDHLGRPVGMDDDSYRQIFGRTRLGRPLFTHHLKISEDIGCREVAYVTVTRRVDGVARTAATLTRALQAVQDVPIGQDKP